MTGKKKSVTTVDAVERRLAHRYPTRWKLRRNTLYLPTELIYNILLFVPAKALFYAARYVCKQWHDIVNDPDFIRAHCRMSTPGFLIQDIFWSPDHTHMISIESETSNPTEIQIPFRATVKSCFNGLVLVSTPLKIFHVVNPVTKEIISLPRLEVVLAMSGNTAGLAVDSRGHYKVVFASYEQIQMSLFTIGIDKAWRFIDIPVNLEMKSAMSYSPQVFGGFIYWYTYKCFAITRSYGFALDIDTETIYQFSQPDYVVENLGLATFISMGTSLGFMLIERKVIWRLWKLTNVKSGEWTELPHINVSTLHSHFDKVFGRYINLLYYPVKLVRGVLWLYRRVKDRNLVVRYNFINDNMVVFPMKTNIRYHSLWPHVNTLVSPRIPSICPRSTDRRIEYAV